MHLENISAYPDPGGNKIILSWVYPDGTDITGVHIRRQLKSHPTSLDDGEPVPVTANTSSCIDSGLKGNTVYYYSFFPYVGDSTNIIIDRHNRTHAMATTPMAYSDYMYNLLPLIYHRYDKNLPIDPTKVAEEDRAKGQLQRFVDIIGGQLDLLHSYAQVLEDSHSAQKVEGVILPLLAEWIGWRLDLKQELADQRNEVDNAPEVYKSIGIIPTIQHTVKRISNWESRSKEFVHNVFLSNRPERLNLWSLLREGDGTWSPDTELFSLDYAYEGRPCPVEDDQQVRWLFYHTCRNGKWEIWYKTSPTFDLESAIVDQLAVGTVSDAVRLILQDVGINIASDALLSQAGNQWLISDATNSEMYLIQPGPQQFTLYHLSADPVLYSPSRPIVRDEAINKYPTCALQNDTLWLFWSECGPYDNKWYIHYRQHHDGEWLEIDLDETNNSPFRSADVVDQTTPRYRPNAVTDREGNLWLFWMELSPNGWQLKYNKFSGGSWGSTAHSLPAGSVGQFSIDADVSVLMASGSAGPQIYIFWSHNVATGTGSQTRWQIDFQVKTDLILDELNWFGVYDMDKDSLDDDYHDREPFAVTNAGGDIEFFWSSNQSGNWAIWHRTLDSVDTSSNAVSWGLAERITQEAYSCRDALPLLLNDGRLLLVSRSNKSPAYVSESYQAMLTLDQRYSGSTTQHVRNTPKRNLHGEFEDFNTYTYDTGQDGERDDLDRYARDTIGIYLEPDTMDNDRINAEISRLRPVVKEFMPLTGRVVYIPRKDLHTELVYTYGQPLSPTSRYIVSSYHDEFTSVLTESMLAPGEDFIDSLT